MSTLLTPPVMSTPTAEEPRRLLSDLRARILSRADCDALFRRIVGWTTAGGETTVTIRSTWSANLRWARNRPTISKETTAYEVTITRVVGAAELTTTVTQLDDTALKAAVADVETRVAQTGAGASGAPSLPPLTKQVYRPTTIWSDATARMPFEAVSAAVRTSVQPVAAVQLNSAGYAEVGATAWAVFNTKGLDAYAAATGGLYGVRVRNTDGTASGAAALSHMDWAKLDVDALAAVALRKCRESAHAVKIEPGRYTAILEPEATMNILYPAIAVMDRYKAEQYQTDPYYSSPGESKIGQRVFDSRITLTSDPSDPDCGFIPFNGVGYPYDRVTWVENGVLKELPYDRAYALEYLKTDTGLPMPLAVRMSGGGTSIEEMIATTERGIYVSHFGPMSVNDMTSLNATGVTQDGLWLIEHGKITHPIKNLWVNDSPLVIFNQVEQLGPPVRIVGVQRVEWGGVDRSTPTAALNNGHIPMMAPPVKVRDFNFVRLSDAI